jgi:hypothetical protein
MSHIPNQVTYVHMLSLQWGCSFYLLENIVKPEEPLSRGHTNAFPCLLARHATCHGAWHYLSTPVISQRLQRVKIVI